MGDKCVVESQPNPIEFGCGPDPIDAGIILAGIGLGVASGACFVTDIFEERLKLEWQALEN